MRVLKFVSGVIFVKDLDKKVQTREGDTETSLCITLRSGRGVYACFK